MPANLITTEDLRDFKMELLDEFKKLLKTTEGPKKYLKSSEIRQLLKISPGTLQTLRINGTLPYTKIGGVILYETAKIQKVLDANSIQHR